MVPNVYSGTVIYIGQELKLKAFFIFELLYSICKLTNEVHELDTVVLSMKNGRGKNLTVCGGFV